MLAACGAQGPKTTGPIAPITVESTSDAEQRDVAFTFGQAFAAGDLSPQTTVSATTEDGLVVPLQVDVKATHADGTVRHAVLSGVIPQLAAGESRTLTLTRGLEAPSGAAPTPQALLAAGFRASVTLVLGGQTWQASADELLGSDAPPAWLSGPVAGEWLLSAPLKTAAGDVHPHLAARFAIRTYSGTTRARVDVTIENDWAYEPAPQNFTYDARIDVGGNAVFSQAALTHFHHARWRKTFWWGEEPKLHLRHDSRYLIASKAVPNYDPSVTVPASTLDALGTQWAKANKAPMGPGIVLPAMPTTGGRNDIGPLPQWSAVYVLSMDAISKATVLGTGDLAGSWPIDYRNKLTDLPVSLKDFPYMTLLGTPGDTVNPATKQSEAFPACGGTCDTAPINYQPDSSHQPSLAYLPYLVTGDHFYLEELQFWASWNVFRSNPYYRQFEKGLVSPDQVRGQAWSLRTLGDVASITPDDHPLKGYFSDVVASNLAWYTETYVRGNPNALGVIDGSGKYAFNALAYTTPSGPKTGVAPWQDDFFTWSVGHLVELGFTDARPILAWKAKFPVGRMTGSFCWIDGGVYALAVRSSETGPMYSSFADAYQATMRGTDASGQPVPLVNSTGAKYLDQACGSQAQANWRTQADKDANVSRPPWVAGEMTGYASSVAGYPSNLQPALAAAADADVPDAQAAWKTFANRSVKPDYGTAPQWAIVPRR